MNKEEIMEKWYKQLGLVPMYYIYYESADNIVIFETVGRAELNFGCTHYIIYDNQVAYTVPVEKCRLTTKEEAQKYAALYEANGINVSVVEWKNKNKKRNQQ